MWRRLLCILISAGFLGACASGRSAQKIGSVKSALGVYDQIQSLLEARASFLKEVMMRTSTPRSEPYPRLEENLTAMRRELTGAEEDKERILRLDRESRGYASGKISSNDAQTGHSLRQDLKDRQSRNTDSMKNHLKAARAAALDFDQQVDAFGISTGPSAPQRKQVENMAQEINRGLEVMRHQLILARDFVKAEHDPLWRRQADSLLMGMEIKAARLEQLRVEFDKTQIDFDRETRTSDQIWRGPGLASRDQMGAMISAHRESSEVYEQFSSDAKTLEGLGAK